MREAVSLPPQPPDHRRPRHPTHLRTGTRSQRREKSLAGTFLSDQGPKAAGFPSLQIKDRVTSTSEFRTRTEPSADVSVENTRSQRGACAQTSARWGGLSSLPIATRQARSAGDFGLRLRYAHAHRGHYATPPHCIRAFNIRVFLRICGFRDFCLFVGCILFGFEFRFSETGTSYVAQPGLGLQSSCPCLPSTRFTRLCHHAQLCFLFCFAFFFFIAPPSPMYREIRGKAGSHTI